MINRPISSRPVTGTAALLLSAAVALGAVGAHAVPEGAEQLWRIANHWHLGTALGLLVLGVGWNGLAPGWRALGAGVLGVGLVLFPGSLYLQAMTGAPPFPGSAPIGGSALILGWIIVAVAAFRGSSDVSR
jgi:uncharacterized membrane protein YgdD (TMEM256/DUF423 family)